MIMNLSLNFQELLDLLQFPFMQRAILGAVLMGILGGFLGPFITLRQLSFFSHAICHAALVGVTLGVLLNINPTLMLFPFTLVFGIVTLYLVDKTDLGNENILSIVLSGALAIGIILTSLIKGYRGNLMAILFGDILAIDTVDLILTFVVLVSSSIFLLSTLKQQILLTLNPDVAQVHGISVQLYRYSFVVFLSLVVAVTIQAVGVLLVNAFLVIPASTAKLISHHFSRFLILSVIIGASSSIVGIMFSGLFSLASGPSIVLSQCLLFVTVLSGIKLNKSFF